MHYWSRTERMVPTSLSWRKARNDETVPRKELIRAHLQWSRTSKDYIQL